VNPLSRSKRRYPCDGACANTSRHTPCHLVRYTNQGQDPGYVGFTPNHPVMTGPPFLAFLYYFFGPGWIERIGAPSMSPGNLPYIPETCQPMVSGVGGGGRIDASRGGGSGELPVVRAAAWWWFKPPLPRPLIATPPPAPLPGFVFGAPPLPGFEFGAPPMSAAGLCAACLPRTTLNPRARARSPNSLSRLLFRSAGDHCGPESHRAPGGILREERHVLRSDRRLYRGAPQGGAPSRTVRGMKRMA
jgi:hypothetical protein